MNDSPLLRADDDERVRWIKKLREREGISRERPDFPLDLFAVKSWDELVGLIEVCLGLIVRREERAALSAALGLDLEAEAAGSSVIKRRQVFADRDDISLRSAERLEDDAAKRVAALVRVMSYPEYGRLTIRDMESKLELLEWWSAWRGIELPSNAVTDIQSQLRAMERRIARS